MLPCGICLQDVDTPVALPCGHVFCSECIQRSVDAIQTYSTYHTCPNCHSLYTTATVDPSLAPPHLRLHLMPSVRRIFLHPPKRHPRTVPSTTEIAVENSRLHAELSALRTNCEMWRKRAEAHASTTLSLLTLARAAKSEADKMMHERDEMSNYTSLLKRKIPDDELPSLPHPPSLSSRMDLPPLPEALRQLTAIREEQALPSSLSRRLQPGSPNDATVSASTRMPKRARLTERSEPPA